MGHLDKVETNQRRFASTLAHITGIRTDLAVNRSCVSYGRKRCGPTGTHGKFHELALETSERRKGHAFPTASYGHADSLQKKRNQRMRNALPRLRLLAALLAFASVSACSAQTAPTVGYLVKESVHFGGSSILVDSVRIYGSPEALTDNLVRSGFFDCSCLLMKPANCNLSLLKLEKIQAPESLPPGIVKIVIPKASDFVKVYEAVSKSPGPTLDDLKFGVIRGRQARAGSEHEVRDNDATGSETGRLNSSEESHVACKKHAKLCISDSSASFVIGCEGLAELEISTDGEVSFSLSAGSVKSPKP